VDLRVAQAELNVIVQRLGRKSPEDENLGLRVTSLQEQAAGPVKKGFFILLGAVGMVLLLACLNVANLLLARNARRRREIAVRAALGASRLRLIRQLLVESLILAFLGGSLGLVSAPFGILILRALAPPRLPRLDNVGIDGWVLAFTLGVTVFTGIVVGVIPAIQVSRLNPVSSLKEESVGSAIGSGLIPLHRAQGALTTYQVALATILLIGAGLVVRSFSRLMGVNLGFDPHNLLTVQLGETSLMPLGKEAILSFYQRVLDEVRALPGVESVALGSIAPVAGVSVGTAINVEGGSPGTGEKGLFYPPWGGNPKLIVQTQDVSPAYFTTMRIRILRGRGFTIQDTPHVVIINEAAARRFWPNTNPLGRRIDVGGGGHNWCEVVGVADDVRDVGLEREPVPEIYSLIHAYSLESTLFVRADSKPQALGNAVVNRIWFVDKGEPVFEVITIEDLISKSVVGPRFHAALLSLFAVLALLMAALGVYGVVSYAVSQRTQEIGIRVALGATPRRIFVLVVGQQLIMAVFGMAIGLGAASALTRTISSLLYGVAPNDLGTFVGVPILLGLAALVASYMPARRAMRVDPMVALRYE
jgi:putative ABC transport system permease protein